MTTVFLVSYPNDFGRKTVAAYAGYHRATTEARELLRMGLAVTITEVEVKE